ncbi:helix-turn-helix domain-containing protein [Frateuria terrea]|uniref:AraC-type DNA-binding protein n=1 Tax=Frateuria terrea TaxID=529704 RepID=A0A1H6QZK0_9GAMM|nr:helix-turn-helix domain-containing protein [Frateuria terrea]SEI49059.1 AraC-type DNA-binding protein [Frateuria terrea]SFP14545.1 AraC-type DNA-binding protein [Frateuria terrea]
MNPDLGQPRGVLRQHLDGELEHRRHAPDPALAPFIEHYWRVRWKLDAPQTQETLPHPNVQLIIERGLSRIYGVHGGRFVRVLEGCGCVFGVKFRAGGFHPFLRRPVATLANRSLPITRVLSGAASLEAEVLACDSMEAMAAVVDRHLVAHLPAPDPQATRAGALVARIAADPALTTVQSLAESAGMGVRTLQRLFGQYVGVSPKWVISRYRLHEALAQMQAGRAIAWAELALSLGYFDQAHFVRDFTRLVGHPPGEYERREGRH